MRNALLGGYAGFCWQQSREILDSWNESQVLREDFWLLKWVIVCGGGKEEYRIESWAWICCSMCHYCCSPPCPTSALLVTLRSHSSPPSSSSFILHFHILLASYQPSLHPKVTTLVSERGCEKEPWKMQLCFVLCSLQCLVVEQFTEEEMCWSFQSEDTEQRRDIEKT